MKTVKRSAAKPRRGRKTSVETPVQLRPQPHGGALQIGNPANAGGPGRPPSAIRLRFRESLDRRLPILEQVADGEATERLEVPLSAVLRHAACPKCGGGLKAADGVEPLLVTVIGKVSPRARDRILAIGEMGKIGMTTSRLDVEEVRARVLQTLAIIRAEFPAPEAERVIERLKPVWTAA